MKELHEETVAIILAGGVGERLLPLTEHRAKPAVPFGGKYRIIDFVLSNCIHSDLSRILVIPQYKFDSLIRHLNLGWNIFNTEKGEYLRVLPPQMRLTKDWYQGTADAVYQNIYSLSIDQPRNILILSGDQIYRMDYRKLLHFHLENGADLTVAAVEGNRETAQRSGVLEINTKLEVTSFGEKPALPKSLPGEAERFLISMGIYVFNSKVLIELLEKDMAVEDSKHDFGRDIIPRMIKEGKRIFPFLFQDEETGKATYWRDIGTIDSYFEANMDLVEIQPQFNLYDPDWPWRTFQRQLPPAKIVFQERIRQSIISGGCVIDEGEVSHSILSSRVKVGKGTQIVDSIIMDDVVVEDGVRIIRAVIDKENIIPAGSIIESGNMKYEGRFKITPSGIVVIPRLQIQWRGD